MVPNRANLVVMADEHGTIVVIEDDPHISDLVDMYLRKDGFRVLQSQDGEKGLEIIEREHPRLIVLDIGLPGELDGLEVCKTLRKTSSIPIVMLTARDDEVDRILGLELGADDYLSKPFSPRELVARIKAILRRSETQSTQTTQEIHIGSLTIDISRHEVFIDGELVELATREFDLLEYLASHKGMVRSRQQLLDGVWGVGWYGDERTVDVHIRQLRKKLGDNLPLSTIWGVGYRLG